MSSKMKLNLFILSLLLGLLISIFQPLNIFKNISSVNAKSLGSPLQTRERLCGKLIFFSSDSPIRIGLKTCEGEILIFGQGPAELLKYYEFRNAIVATGDPIITQEFGKLKQYIVGWDEYHEIINCYECGMAPSYQTTEPPSILETQPVIEEILEPSEPELVIIDYWYDPKDPEEFMNIKIHLIVENIGAPIPQTSWDYEGMVFLNAQGVPKVEEHPFSLVNSSMINIAAQKWEIQIPVRFNHSMNDGTVEVVLIPFNYSISPPSVFMPIQIKSSPFGLACTSVVVSKLSGGLIDNNSIKAIMDFVTAETVTATCDKDDIKCSIEHRVTAIIKIFLRPLNIKKIPVGKIITNIWSVLDVDALEVCRDPFLWIWQLVKEFNKQGVAINLIGVHSPVEVIVTNNNGQKSGVIYSGDVLEEIPDSKAIEFEGVKYIIYPEQEAVIQFKGLDNGEMSADLILGTNGFRQSISFWSVPVIMGMIGEIDSSDQELQLLLDINGDGSTEVTLQPDRKETIGLVPEYDVPEYENDHDSNSIVVGSDNTLISPPGGIETSKGNGGMGFAVCLIPFVFGGFLFLLIRTRNRNLASVEDEQGASLAIIAGNRYGTRYFLKDKSLIGRSRACDVFLPDLSVSRRHAQFRYAQGEWFIQDLVSSHGTFVNDQPVKAALLKTGDHITIGAITLVFQQSEKIGILRRRGR